MSNSKTSKFKTWCDLCDTNLTGDVEVCSTCGHKAKRDYPKRLKNTNFNKRMELDLDD